MPTPNKIKVLMAIWNKVCPFKDATEKRDARLHYIAAVIGRQVTSANDLTEPELQQVIGRLLLEVRPARLSSRAKRSGAEGPARGNNVQITKEQIWKIRQIEQSLGWHTRPERLAGFLLSLFKRPRPELLSHAQAWRAIEALFSLAARERAKRRLGDSHQVGKTELAAEVQTIKNELHSWNPPAVPEAEIAQFLVRTRTE